MAEAATLTPQTKATESAPVSEVLPLQEEAVQTDKRSYGFLVQPKLTVGAPDDPYEKEADSMADRVMRMPERNFVQRKCDVCKVEEKISRKPMVSFIQKKSGGESSTVSNEIANQINETKGKGGIMNASTKSFMEDRFGSDFSDVRLHSGSDAVQMSKQLNAQAFTTGTDIYFNSGKYAPDAESGKHLLAHELTHVVQQKNFLQRQPASGSMEEQEINVTDELLEIPFSDEAPVAEEFLPGEMLASETDYVESNAPGLVIQRKQGVVQRDDTAPVTIVRKNLVFIMGTSGGFYIAAKKFFSQHHPEAEIVEFKDRSLGGIFDVLRTTVSDTTPAGNIYIVSHANQDGTLSFPLTSKDKDKILTFGELKVALKNKKSIFNLNGGIDEQTSIHIKGCNIGRNTEMLNAVDEAFGGKDKVDAPTHKQSYEYHPVKDKKKSSIVSSEYFNTLILEYSGSAEKDTDALVTDFKEKYSDFNYQDHEWKMMVMGIKKYNASIDKEGREKKAEIDKDAKEKKKEVDKADKDAIKVIDADSKTAKGEVDKWLKEMKTSKVANKSPGVSKKIGLKFTATLYDTIDPAIDTAKALPFAGKLLGKSVPKGFSVTKCDSIAPNSADPLSHDFIFLAENKKKTQSMTFTYTTPKLPKTDEDGSAIADGLLEETISEKPETEIARRDMYSWRIDRKKGKNTIKVTAFLEMTQYKIDVDLKEETGDMIDPARKEGDDFYYGDSDFK